MRLFGNYVMATSQIIPVTSQIIAVTHYSTYYDIMSTYIIIELVLHVVMVCIASLYHTNGATWNWEHRM